MVAESTVVNLYRHTLSLPDALPMFGQDLARRHRRGDDRPAIGRIDAAAGLCLFDQRGDRACRGFLGRARQAVHPAGNRAKKSVLRTISVCDLKGGFGVWDAAVAILPGTGRGTMRSMVEGHSRFALPMR